MNLSLVLMKGDFRSDVTSLLPELGHHATGKVTRDLCGLQVWAAVERMNDEANGPRDFVRIGLQDGWTILADESGRLVDNPHTWSDWARLHEITVLAAFADPEAEMCAFALFGPQGRQRAVACCGEETHRVGDALAIEHTFADRGRLEARDLIVLMQSLGVDFGHINNCTQFSIFETSAYPVASGRKPASVGSDKGLQRPAQF